MKSAAEHGSALVVALTSLLVVAQIGWSAPAWAQSGALDPAFGAGGKVTTDFSRKADLVQGVAVQPDGKIVAVGWATVGGVYRFGLARYDPDGSLDSTFGTSGKVTTVFGGGQAMASAVAIQSDGKIVVVGTTDANASANYQFALARYNSDGELDTTFSSDGMTTTTLSGTYSSAHAVALQEDGKIVVAGYDLFEPDASGFALARYTTTGSLDSTFGNGRGWVITDFGGSFGNATSVALQPDGKIVVAGASDVGASNDFALARYHTDGSLDTTFGFNGDGLVTTEFFGYQDYGQSVAVDGSGNIVVAGQAYGANGIRTFALARYTPDGLLDPSFDSDGMVTTDFLNRGSFALAVVVDGNGIVAAGAAQGRRGRDLDFALARFSHVDGSLVPTFGTNGKVTTSFSGAADVASALALDGNGHIVAAGQTQDKNFALARYRP